jgi:hypothetical protein
MARAHARWFGLAIVGAELAAAAGCEAVTGIGDYQVVATTTQRRTTSTSTATTGAGGHGGATTTRGPGDCNDGLRNGEETDVDCGGSVCAAKCDAAQTCAVDTDCGEGLGCTNGFCCYEPCATVCMSCVGKLTTKQDGQCRPMTAGTQDVFQNDPKKGTCNGGSACDGDGGCVPGGG